MGLCHGKQIQNRENQAGNPAISWNTESLLNSEATQSSNFTLYSPSPLSSFFKNSPANSSVNSTPLRIFKRPFPPPSPAKHIKALLFRTHGSIKPNEASIPEENELGLDKNFGLSKQFVAKYVLGEEIGRGHFGYTCSAIAKKGEQKGQEVAVKVIPKSKKLSMTHMKSMAVMISPWEMEMWGIEMHAIIAKSISILSDAGLVMAMFSLGLFMALQPWIIACGNSIAGFAMAVRFLMGPAVMAVASIAVGLRGVLLRIAIVQAAFPQGIVPFVFAKEYNVHPDILSTGVIFGMLIALPITLVYYILLGL